ncbi:MAG: DUF2878 domain-containing protein [Woeseiaceae bacterium]
MIQLVANFLFFQVTWLALVAGAAKDMIWPGALLCMMFLTWEFYHASNRRGLALMLLCGLAGSIIVDGSYVLLGIAEYAMPLGPIVPLWIMGLWIIFSLTIPQSMSWMRKRPVVGALMAGLAAPLSYLAGHKLDAISFPIGLSNALLITALTWIPAIYLMIVISMKTLPITNAEAQKKPT